MTQNHYVMTDLELGITGVIDMRHGSSMVKCRKSNPVCLGFYPVSTVFQLFNGDSSQIHVSWTFFNQYLTSPLS